MGIPDPNRRRDAYIGVTDHLGRRSSILHLWTKRGQVYVATKGMGGVDKISFHTPTYCQHAYDTRLPLPHEITRRQSALWQRPSTPPVGLRSASPVFKWQVPSDTLSAFGSAPPPQVEWVAAAPLSQATIVVMAFTAESEDTVRSAFTQGGLHLIWQISAGESFIVSSHFSTCNFENITMPASHHEERHLVVSSDDPDNTGRPIRLSMFNHPEDGQPLVGWDLGGYWTDKHPPDGATITRQTTVAQSGKFSNQRSPLIPNA